MLSINLLEKEVTGDGLATVVSNFFTYLFNSTNPLNQEIERASEDISSRLTEYMRKTLSARYTADESVVGEDVTKVYLNVLNGEASIVAFETLHLLGSKKSETKGYMAVKLDMSKAYDQVEWAFLKAVMAKMNFPDQWINLVLDCISTSNLSFSLNGMVVYSVSPSRGLRQGCPLSPYLFLQCAEAFSSLITKAERNGRVLGTRCCRGSPLTSHLLFADDSMLFCKASMISCNKIQEILMVYEGGSGQ
ncbi:hypothetical protein Ddye_025474 [Dipteronia dyeriana]|uniref:Reverse transcriptase domain-containing protein n=1 Tax=Dipteronia dyeriana TaxID=168575 RepID=A0AAD9WNA3_9ROSI|nr:hypothetical protein Ddye_025474 [Dipteronia dyeriana]